VEPSCPPAAVVAARFVVPLALAEVEEEGEPEDKQG